MEDFNKEKDRCKQCEHLMSFHGEEGCNTWLLGVRAVPLYRCACVVTNGKTPKKFPQIPTSSFGSGFGNVSYNPSPARNVYSAKLNPVPPHIGNQIKPIQYDNKTNPEQVLASLADTLGRRDIWEDNDYTESQRQKIIVLALSLQKALNEMQNQSHG